MFKNKKFTPEKIGENIKRTAFEYYFKSDFPYVRLRDFEIWQEFLSLKNSKSTLRKGVINEGVVSKNSFGQKICYHFMPHEWAVKCAGRALAPIDAFYSEKWLKKIIHLAYKYDLKVNGSSIRTFAKTVNSQFAANFPPSVSKTICNNYLGNNGIYYDYSCGFGGRLLGFIASDFIERGAKYIGVEPSTKTYIGLLNMVEFFDVKEQAFIYRDVAENFCPDELKGKVQLAFSSPPYFNREVYSDEKTQSCNKFKTWDDWLNGFWYKTIDNCHKLLKDDGYFIANINDIRMRDGSYLRLIDKTAEYCKDKFAIRHPDLFLFMSGFGAGMDKKKKEIILVFQKKQTIRKIKRRK